MQDMELYVLSCEHGEYSWRTMKPSSQNVRSERDLNGLIQFPHFPRKKSEAQKAM